MATTDRAEYATGSSGGYAPGLRRRGDEDDFCRAHKQEQVKGQRYAIQVLEIQPEFVGQHDFAVVAIEVNIAGEQFFFVAIRDGGEIGHAGTHREHLALERGIRGNVSRNLRARADEAHFTDKDVPQLRKLVELQAPQPMPYGGDAGIVSCGEGWAELLGIHSHGAE